MFLFKCILRNQYYNQINRVFFSFQMSLLQDETEFCNSKKLFQLYILKILFLFDFEMLQLQDELTLKSNSVLDRHN